MNAWVAELPAEMRRLVRLREQPAWTEPMLATLTDRRFSDDDWIFERKLDGERCLAFRSGAGVRLLSRNRKELNAHYPELVDALARQGRDQFIIDGEIVAFKGDATSFSLLQDRMGVADAAAARQTGVAVFYYVFDVMYLDGYDVTQLPQRHRKSVLKEALLFSDPIRFSAHRNREGEAYFEEACRKGWEGIVAKDANAPYVHGRSAAWLKFKCVRRQEFLVGGYTEPAGSRVGLGALLVGYYDGGELRYAGKVGTGFDADTLKRLKDDLSSLEQADAPFAAGKGFPRKGVHWVRPKLVAEVGFEEWTDDGRLRQPRFEGLREDKSPRQVVKEVPGG